MKKLGQFIESLLIEQRDANHIVWSAALCALGIIFHSVLAGWLLAAAWVIGKELFLDDDASFRDIVLGAIGIALASAGAFPGIVPALLHL